MNKNVGLGFIPNIFGFWVLYPIFGSFGSFGCECMLAESKKINLFLLVYRICNVKYKI